MPVVQFDARGSGKVTSAYEKIKQAARNNQKEILADAKKLADGQTKLDEDTARKRKQIADRTLGLIRTSERRAADARSREREREEREARAAGRIVQRVARDNMSQQELLNEEIKRTTEAFEKAGGSPELLKQHIKKLNDEYANTATHTESSFGQAALTKVATFAAGVFSVSKAMQVITREMEAQQRLTDKANQTQLTTSQARNVLLRNLTGATPAQREDALDRGKRLAGELNLPESVVQVGLAEAVSGAGGVEFIDEAEQFVRTAARFSTDQPGAIGQIAGSLSDLSKVTGTADARVNLGLLTLVGEKGRVVDAKKQATNIAPALVNTIPFGGDAATSGSLFAALTNAGADVTGERTGTAVDQLAEKLSTFESTKDLETLRERIAFLQSNRTAAEKFLSDFGGEAKTKGIIRDLFLNPESPAARLFRSNLSGFGRLGRAAGVVNPLLARLGLPELDARRLGEIGDTATFLGAGENALNVFSTNDLEPVAKRTRAFASTAEEFALRRTGSLSSEEREQLRAVLVGSGLSATRARFRDFVAGFGDGAPGLSTESAIDLLEERRDELSGNVARFNPQGLTGRRELTGELKTRDDALADLIRDLKESLDEQTNELREIRDKTGGLVGSAE